MCILETFKQQLALKCECIVEFLLFSNKGFCNVYFGETGIVFQTNGSYTLHGTRTGTRIGTRMNTIETSGVHGGYRLVSTYDLPDCKTTTGGWYFGVNFGHLKSEVFRNWGGISE